MVQTLAVALLVGLALTECCIRAFAQPWVQESLADIRLCLRAFQVAEYDDARQMQLMRCGRANLRMGLRFAALLMLLLGLAALPTLLLRWTQAQQTLYAVASSLVAIPWWLVRRRLGEIGRAHV